VVPVEDAELAAAEIERVACQPGFVQVLLVCRAKSGDFLEKSGSTRVVLAAGGRWSTLEHPAVPAIWPSPREGAWERLSRPRRHSFEKLGPKRRSPSEPEYLG
jgi:hypothetical protein